jgi:hypothetical protein
MFENAVIGIQYSILGHTNLKALSILGDLLIIPLFAVLYLMWRGSGGSQDYTLLDEPILSDSIRREFTNCPIYPLDIDGVCQFMDITIDIQS